MLLRKHLPLFRKTFNEVIQPFKAAGSISVTSGKKVFDIRPEFIWNKGDFAKLVIKEIAEETKTSPVVIYKFLSGPNLIRPPLWLKFPGILSTIISSPISLLF